MQRRDIKFRYIAHGETYIYELYQIKYGYMEFGILDPEHFAGEWTGLKDKNGVDVYEGDILQMYRHDDNTHKHEKAKVWVRGKYHNDTKEVKFMQGSFVIWSELIRDFRCFAHLARPGESFEVIGNIYSNPELLNL